MREGGCAEGMDIVPEGRWLGAGIRALGASCVWSLVLDESHKTHLTLGLTRVITHGNRYRDLLCRALQQGAESSGRRPTKLGSLGSSTDSYVCSSPKHNHRSIKLYSNQSSATHYPRMTICADNSPTPASE